MPTPTSEQQNKPWYNYDVFQGFKWSLKNTYGHSGIDLPMPLGTPLTSPVAGQIAGASCHKWGVQVDVRFSAADGTPRVVSFLHLAQLAPGVKLGNMVQPGTLLGYSGGVSSGIPCPTDRAFSSGAHLHFELTYGSVPPYTTYNPRTPDAAHYPLNPVAFLAAIRASGISGGNSGNPAVYTAADYAAGNNATLGSGTGTNADNDPGSGAAAHALLVEVPGFYGICAAIDAASQFSAYKPPKSSLTDPGAGPSYALNWFVKNAVAFGIRMGLMGLGFLILWALVLALLNVNKWLGEAGGLVLPLAVAAM